MSVSHFKMIDETELLHWGDFAHDNLDYGVPVPPTMYNTLAVSFECKFDGPSPSHNNLLEIGLYVVERETESFVHKWGVALKPREGAGPETRCMTEFWAKHTEKMAAIIEHGVDPGDAMMAFEQQLVALKAVCKKLVFVAWPIAPDWLFVKSYYHLYRSDSTGTKINPGFDPTFDIGYTGFCVSSATSAVAECAHVSKEHLTTLIQTDTAKHMKAHYTLEDAKAQAIMYLNLMRVTKQVKRFTAIASHHYWLHQLTQPSKKRKIHDVACTSSV